MWPRRLGARRCLPITTAAAAEALPIAQEFLDEEFFDSQSTAEVTERARYKRRTSSGKARQALIRKGLIYDPELGTVDFTVPHFADFMCRRYSLARLVKAATEDESY